MVKTAIQGKVYKLNKLGEIIEGLEWEVANMERMISDNETPSNLTIELADEILLLNQLIYNLENLANRM